VRALLCFASQISSPGMSASFSITVGGFAGLGSVRTIWTAVSGMAGGDSGRVVLRAQPDYHVEGERQRRSDGRRSNGSRQKNLAVSPGGNTGWGDQPVAEQKGLTCDPTIAKCTYRRLRRVSSARSTYSPPPPTSAFGTTGAHGSAHPCPAADTSGTVALLSLSSLTRCRCAVHMGNAGAVCSATSSVFPVQEDSQSEPPYTIGLLRTSRLFG
jgi:hypothetical protein